MIKNDELAMGPQIGQGGQGTVYRAEWCGSPVAVKSIYWGAGHHAEEQALREEAAMLASLRHPRIVLLVGACFQPPHVFLVSELVSGPRGHRNLRQVCRF